MFTNILKFILFLTYWHVPVRYDVITYLVRITQQQQQCLQYFVI